MYKSILALSLAALLVPATGFAAHGERGGYGKQHMDRMATELQLSDDQRQQLESVMQEQRSKHRVLRQETESRINAILNEEQRAKMETQRAERKQRWQERRQQHKGKKSDKRS